jgi:uncharacterized repeat protein (TIGR02543 family)
MNDVINWGSGLSIYLSNTSPIYYEYYLDSYSIVYNPNNATSGSAPVDPNTYNLGQAITLAYNYGILQRSGYIFNGWNTQSDGLGTNYNEGDTFIIGS